MIKEYKTDELTIIWQPEKCIHAVCSYVVRRFEKPEYDDVNSRKQ